MINRIYLDKITNSHNECFNEIQHDMNFDNNKKSQSDVRYSFSNKNRCQIGDDNYDCRNRSCMTNYSTHLRASDYKSLQRVRDCVIIHCPLLPVASDQSAASFISLKAITKEADSLETLNRQGSLQHCYQWLCLSLASYLHALISTECICSKMQMCNQSCSTTPKLV